MQSEKCKMQNGKCKSQGSARGQGRRKLKIDNWVGSPPQADFICVAREFIPARIVDMTFNGTSPLPAPGRGVAELARRGEGA